MTEVNRNGRRFIDHPEPGRPKVLDEAHPALRNQHSLYPSRRINPGFEPLLKSGKHNRKIGEKVVKGWWRDMPMFTLTLEERATCWPGCGHWRDCYGNQMHAARRFASGPELERHLELELADLQRAHPLGFVVRLHVLGDFYSTTYVARWAAWLDAFPALNVWGFTGWPPAWPIGAAIAVLAAQSWHRFAIRVSNGPGDWRVARSIETAADAGDAIICPVQTGRTDCCGTCGLCWQTQRPIAFLTH